MADPFVEFVVKTVSKHPADYLEAPRAVEEHPYVARAVLKRAVSPDANTTVAILLTVLKRAPSCLKKKIVQKFVLRQVDAFGSEAMKNHLERLPRTFPYYREIAKECLRRNGEHYNDLPDDLKKDGVMICIAAKAVNSIDLDFDAIFWSQPQEVQRVINEGLCHCLPKPIPTRYAHDRQFCVAYLRKLRDLSDSCREWIPNAFLSDVQFVKEVAHVNPNGAYQMCNEDAVDLDLILSVCIACIANHHCIACIANHHWFCWNKKKVCTVVKACDADLVATSKLRDYIRTSDGLQEILRGVVQSRRRRETAPPFSQLYLLDNQGVFVTIHSFLGVQKRDLVEQTRRVLHARTSTSRSTDFE
jgi:hypothetical protein